MFVPALLFLVGLTLADQPQRPHIIFIYADDLGWSDVSFHGSPQVPTPNIDALASSGLVLHNYYGDRLCTPSRAALLSGYYPIRLGLQHYVIRHGEPSALPLNVTTLPQHLKGLGYDTHMVGKWHLGCMTNQHTPIHRGFNSFFGYYYGEVDYYDYTGYHMTNNTIAPIFFGIDLQNGTHLIRDLRGQYATELFTEKAIEIINDHDSSKPLFLYLSHLAVHIGTPLMPLQAPPHQVNKFDHIKDPQRKIFAGMTASLDDSVGAVFQALDERGLLQNSLVLFVSDNGGETNPERTGFSSNAPLRGQKFTMWEGGVRVPAVLWSPLLGLREPRVANQLMHVTDWLPTLYSAAGGDVSSLGPIDGLDLWPSLLSDSLSPRHEVLLGMDPIVGMSALRRNDWKVVAGDQSFYFPTQKDPWLDPAVNDPLRLLPHSMDEWVFRRGSVVKDVLTKRGWFLPREPDAWRGALKVECRVAPCRGWNECEPTKRPCLFNIKEDPCEYNNVARQFPEVLQSMVESLKSYEKFAVPPQTGPRDPRSDPRCHEFGYVPWLDPEHISDCPFK